MSTLVFPKSAPPVAIMPRSQPPLPLARQAQSASQPPLFPQRQEKTVEEGFTKDGLLNKASETGVSHQNQFLQDVPGHDSRVSSANQASASRLSRLELLKSAQNYWQHGANRDIVKALAWNYAPGIVLSASLLLPMGPLLAAVGIIPAWRASKRGEKMVNQLLESGRLDQTKGPLARLTKLNALWGLAERPPQESRNVPRRMMHEFNQMLHELFPAKGDPDALALRDSLSIKPGTKAFRWLNHAFNAKTYYAHTSIGKVCRPLRQWAHKIPFAPIKLLLRLPQLLTMLPVVLFNWTSIRNMARHI